MPTIIFKPTESCNSNCVYCDVVRRKAPMTMSVELLELIFRKINEYLLGNPTENISLIWHGGEPLLLGVDYFEKAISLQKKHCPEMAHRIEHAIQSNLTLMKQEFIDVFKKMGIKQMGTSYEIVANVRGFGKKKDSNAYNRQFFKGINILEKNNFGWGFIYVVTKKSMDKPLDIFYHLSNLKLSGGFMMNPVLVYEDKKDGIAITPLEYVEFLGAIFPVWWKNRERYADVDPFKMLTRNIIDKEHSFGCVESGACAFKHLYIGPNGETSQCGRASDWGIIAFDNIQDARLEDILKDEQRKQFSDRNQVLYEGDCKDCRFWYLCHGGCPLDVHEPENGFMRKTEWCDAKRVFLEKYFEPITGVHIEKCSDEMAIPDCNM